MVCKKCEAKCTGVIVPDKWKEGAKNAGTERKINVNMALKSKTIQKPPTSRCKICQQRVQQGHYCLPCAYKKGICKMCGVKILDVKMYRQSSV